MAGEGTQGTAGGCEVLRGAAGVLQRPPQLALPSRDLYRYSRLRKPVSITQQRKLTNMELKATCRREKMIPKTGPGEENGQGHR